MIEETDDSGEEQPAINEMNDETDCNEEEQSLIESQAAKKKRAKKKKWQNCWYVLDTRKRLKQQTKTKNATHTADKLQKQPKTRWSIDQDD